MKNIKKISFLGTGSDVGKSVTATAFCRILKNRGVSVAPFKAQNMSNNSCVTLEGGEIGRAQVVQAEAAGCLPSVHMNPVLLKPSSDVGSQVVVLGKATATLPALDYYGSKERLRKIVRESFAYLAKDHEAIVIEGAGSCAEVNLRQNDIVNFDLALGVDAPVVLVADIDRGGVFAQIIGTLDIIAKEERDLVAGFIINKFRGDPRLFDDGIAYIEDRTQKPVLGLVPYLKDIDIEQEDSASLESRIKQADPDGAAGQNKIRIAVVRLPYISNFTDLDALVREPDVQVQWLTTPEILFDFDAVILPGSKSVLHDMAALATSGWVPAIRRYAAQKRGLVVGLCGGYQLLGKEIEDPLHLEGDREKADGIGLLNISSRIEQEKVVKLSSGKDLLFHAPVTGYEIHMGRTTRHGSNRPLIALAEHEDGAVSEDGRVFGTYLHGLFDSGAFRKQFLKKAAEMGNIEFDAYRVREDFWTKKNKSYDRLAAHYEAHTDVDKIVNIMAGRK